MGPLPKKGQRGALQHPHYHAGTPFTACDLKVEQTARIQLLRRHRRFAHGWGVVCGLKVAAANDPGRPWAVVVCPGYALGPCGDEIYVPRAAPFDLAEAVWTLPPAAPRIFLSVIYAEHERGAVAKPGSRCGCEDPVYVPSRIVDGYDFLVDTELPVRREIRGDFCAGEAPCPPCPPTCEVVLAAITLPHSRLQAVRNSDIDNWTFRQQL